MAYTRSIPLVAWCGRRREAIKTLATAHALVGEVDGRGRPLEIGRPVGNAYVLRVVAEFQAFVRDLHDLVAQQVVALSQPQAAYAPLLIEAVTSGRRVDRGNADLRSLSQDFRRLGLADISVRIGTYNRRWTTADRAYYGDLIALRNALRRGNVMDRVTWARARLPGLDRDHLQGDLRTGALVTAMANSLRVGTRVRVPWGLDNDVEGTTLTAEDFIPTEVVSLDHKWGRGRSDAILRAVNQWTEDGETARQLGYRLGVTRRTVNRLRATCRERAVS